MRPRKVAGTRRCMQYFHGSHGRVFSDIDVMSSPGSYEDPLCHCGYRLPNRNSQFYVYAHLHRYSSGSWFPEAWGLQSSCLGSRGGMDDWGRRLPLIS